MHCSLIFTSPSATPFIEAFRSYLTNSGRKRLQGGIRVDVLPWNSAVASCYGMLRADMQKKGKILGNLDLLIAAHALALELVLITNDRAFTQVESLKIQDWTQ